MEETDLWNLVDEEFNHRKKTIIALSQTKWLDAERNLDLTVETKTRVLRTSSRKKDITNTMDCWNVDTISASPIKKNASTPLWKTFLPVKC